MNKTVSIIMCLAILPGCVSWEIPMTPGDVKSAQNYGYHPIDPIPIELNIADSRLPVSNAHLLNALPDETMRLAIGQFDGKTGLTFGVAATGIKGNQYVVILDYIKFNTNSLPVILEKENANIKANITPNAPEPDALVPTYIGVGLRLTANILVTEGSVDLGNLFALGAAAEAKKISGSLVIQTLGVSGENVSSVIPMPSEINTSTIQNAILALGTIKAKMYANDTKITPRVVGVYNNLGGGAETINGFISSMLLKPRSIDINNAVAVN
ncbi:hypothetical protein [Ectopseudomonas mendocina]|uniref:Uncharacterized protein n=1 Tax=Ectopseudomonas mendocina TaxID=300 RepID=A0A2R3QHZ2_ECTME|nr:hypothetical protein [Pseudomonas mendocina]AVO51401.1 hypothetical protein C7A17_01010 [Pseudomonas mendocina]